MAKFLFILKYRESQYVNESYSDGKGLSSGLLNSASFIVDMLNNSGHDAKLVQVIDNNCIDKEVSSFKPDFCIIEAFWCVSSKLDELSKLHPTVKWIVRDHSAIPFMATEGITIDWTMKYIKLDNVYISPNSYDTFLDIQKIASVHTDGDLSHKVLYLPNYYTFNKDLPQHKHIDSEFVDIGIFGAIRPLKNQLQQCIAAIEFAKQHNKKLRVHINGTRIETGGNEPLKNIRGLFSNLPDDYQLVEHNWLSHDDFLKLISTMDQVLTVSFTETFCIVAADSVSMNVPVIGCSDIKFLSSVSVANPILTDDIVEKMNFAWTFRKCGIIQKINKWNLEYSNKKAEKQWTKVFASF